MEAGVNVRIIGRVEARWQLPAEKYQGKRLHVRAIVRDAHRAFVGSQSLRKPELDRRREIGVIVDDRKTVEEIRSVFLKDWELTPTGKKEAKREAKKALKLEKRERKVA
jgi:phosphatidylserine/phosphatidylglycerophosphate/cardiolipin synthase-like enzyme